MVSDVRVHPLTTQRSEGENKEEIKTEVQRGREKRGESSSASCGLERAERFGFREALQFPKDEEGDLEKGELPFYRMLFICIVVKYIIYNLAF